MQDAGRDDHERRIAEHRLERCDKRLVEGRGCGLRSRERGGSMRRCGVVTRQTVEGHSQPFELCRGRVEVAQLVEHEPPMREGEGEQRTVDEDVLDEDAVTERPCRLAASWNRDTARVRSADETRARADRRFELVLAQAELRLSAVALVPNPTCDNP